MPKHSSTPPATAAQPTIRQRGVGGRPVGNSSGSATSTSSTAGTQAKFATHRPNSATPPGSPGWLRAAWK